MVTEFQVVADVAVVLLVAGAQVAIFVRAWKIGGRSYEAEMESLAIRFTHDLRLRAGGGEAPDWSHCRNELDRLFEGRDERLRSAAAAALAAGLGGTILALIVHLLLGLGGSGAGALDVEAVLPGLGVALFGSLAGVVNHLLIVLWLLPRAEGRYAVVADRALAALHLTADEHPPVSAMTDALRQEIAGLTRMLNEQFANAFVEAVPELPQVVEGLGTAVGELSSMVSSQSEGAQTAVSRLEGLAALVAESGEALAPVTSSLAATAEKLTGATERLETTLANEGQRWLEAFAGEHQRFRDEAASIFDNLQRSAEQREQEMLDRLTEIRQSIRSLAESMGEQLKKAAERAGQQFGVEAGDHVKQLGLIVEADRNAQLEEIRRHEQEWRNSLTEETRNVLAAIRSEVDAGLTERLREIAGEIGRVAGKLPDVAERLETSHERWCAVHEEALVGWRSAGGEIREAAASLGGGEEQLDAAVAALGRTVEHLERLATTTEGFESAVREGLRAVVVEHLEELEPVHRQIFEIVQELRDNRGSFDGVLAQQSQFIRDLLAQALRNRGLRPSDGGAT